MDDNWVRYVHSLVTAHHGGKKRGEDRGSGGMKGAGIKGKHTPLQVVTARQVRSDRKEGAGDGRLEYRKIWMRRNIQALDKFEIV